MGLGFVLVIWAVVGFVVAGVFSLPLSGLTSVLTRGVREGRTRAIRTAAVFPFACLLWAACVFVFQGVVNEVVLGRDMGIGDTWRAPLPNGYQLAMIDDTNEGWIQKSSIQQQQVLAGVRQLQITGTHILAACDSRASEHFGTEGRIDQFYLLDTATGVNTKFDSFDALGARARELKIEPKLQPIARIYSQLRFGWFDVVAGVLLCGPPLIGLVLFFRWVLRLRRTQPAPL